MLDFPSSPSVGQTYPPTPVDGVNTYTWDGEKWTVKHNAPPGMSNPLMNGIADEGVSEAYSREDHVHPSDTSRMSVSGGQTITGGFNIAPVSLPAGNFTINALIGNYQYIANNGVFTITAPANDCAIDVLVTNSINAGAITFTGFTVGSNTGDLLTVTNGHRFIISFRRINAISTYVIKALQ
jgi:hypothetical protein